MKKFAKVVEVGGEQVLFFVSPCHTCDDGHWLHSVTYESMLRISTVEAKHFHGGNMEDTLMENATEENARRILKISKVSSFDPIGATKH